MKLGLIAVLISIFCAGAICYASGETSIKFVSRKYHYEVFYPSSWHLLVEGNESPSDTLDIISFPPSERVEGVVLKDGGAEISVAPVPEGRSAIEKRIRSDTKFDTDVRRFNVRRGKESSSSGCAEIVGASSLSEVGPLRSFRVIRYYCSTQLGLYEIQLTFWRGDPNERTFQETALGITESLRSAQ